MEMKVPERYRLPLTAYDFLGYLVPGAALLLSMFIFELWGRRLPSSVFNPGQSFHSPIMTVLSIHSSIEASSWALQAIFLVAIAALSYICGHIIASVSSLFIDRVLIYKGYGYPYETLLGISPFSEKERPFGEFSRCFYRGLLLWPNAIIILFYFSITFANTRFELKNSDTPLLLWCFQQLYNVVMLMARNVELLVAAYIIVIVLKIILSSSKNQKHFWNPESMDTQLHDRVLWFTTYVWAGLYELVTKFLSMYLNTREHFDDCFKDNYRTHFKKQFKMDPYHAKTNNFWLPLLYVKHNSQQCGDQADNWLRLYGFSRNLAAAFYLSFLYGVASFVWQSKKVHVGMWSHYQVKILMMIPIIYLILSCIMLFRFYYLYVHYYTKYVFRSFIFLSDLPNKASQPAGEASG